MWQELAPLMDLWQTPGVQENLEDAGRIFFSNSALTVNLIPALLVGLLGLFLIPLLFPSLLGSLGGGGGGASYGSNLEISDGYGAPSSGYGAPSSGYGAPAASYGAPAQSYDAPASGYDAPSSGYDAPSSGYDAGRKRRAAELPEEAQDLYRDIKDSGVYNSKLGGFVLSPSSAPHLPAHPGTLPTAALLR